MPEPPTGTITFLFTDVEGSTRRWEAAPAAMSTALARHDALLMETVTAHGGVVFKTIGDAICAAFPAAPAAVTAALLAQRTLLADPASPRVRIALHTGTPEVRGGDYFGPPLNRVARLLAAGHGGQVLLSTATFELVRDHLAGGTALLDLGEHRLKDLARPERVFQLLGDGLVAEFPPLLSLDHRPNNLPIQTTSFVGRERALALIHQQLAGTRLLTLTGVGGTGKTRLALQVAADSVDDFPDGAWFIDLAPITDPELVLTTAAAVLGLREEPGLPLRDTLRGRLRDKRLMLVLDNCEHLLDACARLADDVLHAAPDVAILATSREPLGVPGEVAWPVPPLTLPDPSAAGDHLDVMTQYEAVRLFIDRAVAARPRFSVTNANAPAVAEICHRLDGVPLAIELAAARVRAFSPEEIARRLDDRFRLLSGGARTVLPRQQTLRAAIDWSYELLADPERLLFERLSVFRGGWTAEPAEAVCSEVGLDAFDVADGLAHLVDKSLVVAEEANGVTRYRFLETLREYARERHLVRGEREAIRRRHLAHYGQMAGLAAEGVVGPEQPVWLRRVERDQENIRAALDTALRVQGHGVDIAALAESLARLWNFRGQFTEAERQLAAIAAACDRVPDAAKARLAYWAGFAAMQRDNWPQMDHFFADAFRLSEASREIEIQSWIWNDRGLFAMEFGTADEAAGHFERALPLKRQIGKPWDIVITLTNLGEAQRRCGNVESAQVHLTEALTIVRSSDDEVNPDVATMPLFALGMLALQQGDLDEAERQFRDIARRLAALGSAWKTALYLQPLATVALRRPDSLRAARLLAAVEAVLEATESAPAPSVRRQIDDDIALGRSLCSGEEWAAAWAEGAAMSVDEAVAYALEEGDRRHG